MKPHFNSTCRSRLVFIENGDDSAAISRGASVTINRRELYNSSSERRKVQETEIDRLLEKRRHIVLISISTRRVIDSYNKLLFHVMASVVYYHIFWT